MPLSLDQRGGDVLTATRESLLTGAWSGVYPVSVSRTAAQLAAACATLQRKLAVQPG